MSQPRSIARQDVIDAHARSKRLNQQAEASYREWEARRVRAMLEARKDAPVREEEARPDLPARGTAKALMFLFDTRTMSSVASSLRRYGRVQTKWGKLEAEWIDGDRVARERIATHDRVYAFKWRE